MDLGHRACFILQLLYCYEKSDSNISWILNYWEIVLNQDDMDGGGGLLSLLWVSI